MTERQYLSSLIILSLCMLMGILFLGKIFIDTQSDIIISPIPSATPIVTPYPTLSDIKISGQASYYSRAGCLGCSPTFTMANGQILDDKRETLAMVPTTVRTYKLLNKNVTVRNRNTNASVVATVTDTGGFSRYSRIADLSVATKLAIGCEDICDVEIQVGR